MKNSEKIYLDVEPGSIVTSKDANEIIAFYDLSVPKVDSTSCIVTAFGQMINALIEKLPADDASE